LFLTWKYFDKGNVKCVEDGKNEMKKYGACIKGWTKEKIRSFMKEVSSSEGLAKEVMIHVL
jgi:hypothetical protein